MSIVAEAAPQPPENLTRAVVGGLSGVMLQAILVKVVGLAAQIALAYILGPTDYGSVFKALWVYSLFAVVAHWGINELLVRLGPKARDHIRSAFWLAMITAALISGLMFAVAGPISRGYDLPQVAPLIRWFAVATFFQVLRSLPEGVLNGEARFNTAVRNEAISYLVWTFSSVTVAALGGGAFSTVATRWPANILSFVLHWRSAKLPWNFRPDFSDWRLFARAGGMLALAGFLWQITQAADQVVLSIYGSLTVAGSYFWAFQQSQQIVQLLAGTLGSILLSSITRMNDNASRQKAAILRATRTLAMICLPMCAWQATLGGPVVRLVFEAKWFGAIPYLQLLLLAMGPIVIGITCIAHLKAQGRFTTYLLLMCGLSALFIACVTAGTVAAPGIGTCWGMLGYGLIMGPSIAWLSIASVGGRLSEILDLMLRPIAACIPATAATLAAIWLFPDHRPGFALQVAVGSIVFWAVYVAVGFALMRDTMLDFASVTRPYWGRIAARMPRLKRVEQ